MEDLPLPNMRKPIIVLNALMNGRAVKLDSEYEFKLFKPNEPIPTSRGIFESDIYWLGIKMDMNGKEVYCGAEDMSLVQFIEYVMKLTTEDIVEIMTWKLK